MFLLFVVASDAFGHNWLENIPVQCCPSMVHTTVCGLLLAMGQGNHSCEMLAQIDPDMFSCASLFMGCVPTLHW